jgi:UDP-2-acetamido-3-amino-2,3-dideoxy-glucuronate N-acetyltransferase
MKKNNFYVHESCYIDENVKIGEGSSIWHFSHLQSGSIIGSNCSIGQNVNIGNNVKIGNFVKVQNNVSIYEGVEIEDYVFCGPSMVFTNVLNPRSEFPQRGSKYYTKTKVQKSASIGANATIICGVTIGKYALIGAGTVITKDVPDFAKIIGNPGKLIGWVDKKGNKLIFDEKGVSTCGKYIFSNDKVNIK